LSPQYPSLLPLGALNIFFMRIEWIMLTGEEVASKVVVAKENER